MTQVAQAKQLLSDLRADLMTYRKLMHTLDKQFKAALRLDVTALNQLGTEISTEIDVLDARRRMRAAVLGTEPGAAERLGMQIFPEPDRAAQRMAVAKRCDELEQLIQDCKTRTTRNGSLLAAQFEAMQRVLHGEQHTYVPA